MSKVVEQRLRRYYAGGGGVAVVFDQLECSLSYLSCALSAGTVMHNCWPCFAPCLSILMVTTCALRLLTYRVIANTGAIDVYCSSF